MKWRQFDTPYRAELIHECNLEDDGKIIVSAGKGHPVSGRITHYGHKQIGKNIVKMYLFYPDIAPDKEWELSSKWFQGLRKDNTLAASQEGDNNDKGNP